MPAIELDLNNPADAAELRRLMRGRRRQVVNEPAPPGGHWCLALPRHTVTVNALMYRVAVRVGLKKADRELVAEWARRAGIPAASGKRRVRLTVVLGPKQRAADPDAWFKSLGDALTCAGLIRDDGPKWVEWAPVAYARGTEARMFVELEDVCNER